VKIWHLILAIALTAPVSATAQTAEDPNDIVVMAQKMKRLTVSYSINKKNGVLGVKNCKIKRSSGDAEIDLIPCQVVSYCVNERQLGSSESKDCVRSRGRELIAELRERRSMARDPQ
jgi:hypothetical protein